MLPPRSLVAFWLVAMPNESEVREELEIPVPYSLAGTRGQGLQGQGLRSGKIIPSDYYFLMRPQILACGFWQG